MTDVTLTEQFFVRQVNGAGVSYQPAVERCVAIQLGVTQLQLATHVASLQIES